MNLTNEEIRMKIADSLPWTPSIPNYPESLDACAEFEATLSSSEMSDYTLHLLRVVRELGSQDKFVAQLGSFLHITAKPKQRCLAYLKTKGLIP